MEYKTKQQKAEVYSSAKSAISELEGNYKVAMYHKWLTLTSDQKAVCYKEWDDYYKKVRTSKAYNIYVDLSKAFKTGNYAEVGLLVENKKLSENQLQGVYEIQKPTVMNPNDFLMSQEVNNYKRALEVIKNMEKESKNLEMAGMFM